MRVCKKCEKELADGYKKTLCEDCRNKRIKLVGNVVLIGASVTGAVVIGIYLKSNKDAIAAIIKDSKKIPIKPSTEVIPQAEKTTESVVENWLTKTDQQKLDRALKLGKVTSNIIAGAKYRLEKGLEQVDDFLQGWSASDVLSEFPDWRDKVKNISQTHFAEILRDAAKETPDVLNIEVFDKAAQVTFKSRSGKTKWTALYDFEDAAGELSNSFRCQAPYPDSGILRVFADNVTKRMKCAVED